MGGPARLDDGDVVVTRGRMELRRIDARDLTGHRRECVARTDLGASHFRVLVHHTSLVDGLPLSTLHGYLVAFAVVAGIALVAGALAEKLNAFNSARCRASHP